jgi:hypothetical protein
MELRKQVGCTISSWVFWLLNQEQPISREKPR